MLCPKCGKEVGRSDNLRRQILLHDKHTEFSCKHCGRKFERKDNLNRHMRKHDGDKIHKCEWCSYTAERKDAVKRHMGIKHQDRIPDEAEVEQIQAVPEPETGAEKADEVSEGFHPTENPNLSNALELEDTDTDNDGEGTSLASDPLEDLIVKESKRIETYAVRTKRNQDRYNFRLKEGTAAELTQFAGDIFNEQVHPFKLNVSLGFVLQNVLTDELVYYYASSNTRLLEKPVLVRTRRDLNKMDEIFETEDLLEHCRQRRLNTKYVVVLITNALFYVDKIKSYSIGADDDDVPRYLVEKRTLVGFFRNRHGQPYLDKLCFCRSLAYHQIGGYEGLEARAKDLFRVFCDQLSINQQHFRGVKLDHLQILEDMFHVNIEVYSLKEGTVENECDDSQTSFPHEYAVKVFSSRMKYEGKCVTLNLYKRHFSYITDVAAFCRQWSCRKCGRLFYRLNNLKVHERNCSEATKFVFPGGGYGLKKTIFEKLYELGIDVPEPLQYYPFRLAYDFEAMCIPVDGFEEVEDITNFNGVLRRLVPVSCSLCSNVPGFTDPKCFISSGDPLQLIQDFYQYVVLVSTAAYEQLKETYDDVIYELNARVLEHNNIVEQARASDESGDHDQSTDLLTKASRLKQFCYLQQDFEKWLSRLVCLGFNSGKFDINLIRKYLFPYLLGEGTEIQHVIKRNNDYMSIATPHVVFLDIKNYLAAGVSYEKWIASYEIEQGKSCFPYLWLTDVSKLEQASLPSKSEFWSDLKQSGITDAQYTGLQKVWSDNGFRTMRDFLEFYNNRDVEPFIIAAEKLFSYWMGLKIDPFKSLAISLPGLALCYLMGQMHPHTILTIFNKRGSGLYHLMRKNIVGGLSIVMHRYHEVSKTLLPNGKPVGWIYSFDCNSLYLWSIGEPTGTGIYTVWKTFDQQKESLSWKPADAENCDRKEHWNEVKATNDSCRFHKECDYPYAYQELEWLEWMAEATGKIVEHQFNGRQKTVIYSDRIRYPVDGFIPSDQTVLQFHGCRWHGHGCRLDHNSIQDSRHLYHRTMEISARLRGLGYHVIEKWECDWRKEKEADKRIRDFLQEHLQTSTKATSLSGSEILLKIKSGELFGLIMCDLEVPWWNKELIDYFHEFPPICKNADIPIEEIGTHMRQYAEEKGYMKKPRRNLINSFWARQILLTTPIVRWLLLRGLVITRIYQMIEMKPKACFNRVRDEIADKRREADAKPAFKPTGESYKTLGNCTYGKVMTSKESHKDCLVVSDEEVSSRINDPRFHKMEEVGSSAYEVSMDKRRIVLDLPLQVAFYVYNYAKLRMLEFVYDFLKKYLRPGSYQLICSDTDSIIAAYEEKDIDRMVKPELMEEYLSRGKTAFLLVDSYSKRTPGLFKKELGATGIIALCSKTYFAWDDTSGDTKTSSKGLSKRTNHFRREDFFRVLKTRTKGTGVNYGFKVIGDEMFQYKQTRAGLSYLYVKRCVADDGISTTALNL